MYTHTLTPVEPAPDPWYLSQACVLHYRTSIIVRPIFSIVHNIAVALGVDCALGWGNDSSPRVDGWTGMACNAHARVAAIRVRNAGLNDTLPRDIAFLLWLQELDLRDTRGGTAPLPPTQNLGKM